MEYIKEIDIQVQQSSDTELYYGMKVYAVEPVRHESIYEKCPMCDDTMKVTVRGIEAKCPLCAVSGSIRNGVMSLSDYEVCEYIINEITIKGPDRLNAYKGDGWCEKDNFPTAVYKGFRKKNGNTLTRVFTDWSFKEKRFPYNLRVFGDYHFLSKKKAAAFVKQLHEKQMEELREYNEKYGTNHKYPFEVR